jgi:hypothetical protein
MLHALRDGRMTRMPATLVLLAAAAGVGITALLGAATATSPAAAAATTTTAAPIALVAATAAPNHGRCVGMFLDTTSGGGSMYQMLPRQVPADATNLLIIGEIPCRDQVMAWSSRGTYRVFEDGAVQFLASPMPPCPKGDYYVWIEFPK